MPDNLVADFSFDLLPNDYAPCTAKFTDKSVNATAYSWYIKDRNGKDSLFSTISSPELALKLPDTYRVKLVVRNLPLTDSAMTDKLITVRLNRFTKTISTYGAGRKIIQTSDGGYIIAGVQLQSGSLSATDGYIIKHS